MISELGTVRDITYVNSDEAPQETGIFERRDEPAVVEEVTIGSLLERPTIAFEIPKRRPRIRSSSVI